MQFWESEWMGYRFNVITDCLAGCLISALLSILLMLEFDSVFLAFLPMITIPPLSCWLGGLRNRNSLVAIAIFGSIGWFAGTASKPIMMAMRSQSPIERKDSLPLAGYEPVIPSAICAGIFALGCACFVGSGLPTTNAESNSMSTQR